MKLLWIILFTLLNFSIYGQISLSNRSLPKEGNSSLFFVDQLPAQIDPGRAGEDARWNFMSLQSPFIRRSVWTSSNFSLAGNRFSGADLSLQIDQETEAYYKYINGDLYLMGYYGMDPFGLGMKGLYKYKEPIVEWKRKLQYGQKSTHRSSLTSEFTLNELPDALRKLLPLTPDKIRLIMLSQRTDEVDAWGNLLMPGGFFDVLREKRSEARSLRIESKVGSLPWQDITNLLKPNDIFGEHVFLSYYYYSKDIEEPLLRIYMHPDNKGVDKVIYRANQTDNPIQDINSIKPGVYAYPNPAIVNVRFEFTNLSKGKYQLSILNVLGIEVWTKDYFIQNSFTDRVNISFLKKGTYLYALKDSEGKIISTKRIVVIRP